MLLELKNKIEEIAVLCVETENFCKEHNISETKCHDLLLILDEMVTNVIKYGFPPDEEHTFVVKMEKENENILIKIVDSGAPFDPLKKDDPDTELTIEERSIGGLGIFIVKQLSERVEYLRQNDENHLNIHVSANKSQQGE